MTCAWKELLAVLPLWIRREMDTQDAGDLLELRLRIHSSPELVYAKEYRWLEGTVSQEDLDYTVNAASRYSPWAAASAVRGYITIAGGHRIGICGETVIQQGVVTAIKHISSLCIRIARDLTGIAAGLEGIQESVLILGPPGWGKTTLLRDLIRQMSARESICVVDEREELFPPGFATGNRVDVLRSCSKEIGIPMLLRTMSPGTIAVDEITDSEDTKALVQAANCGVRLLATAHAMSVSDFRQRVIYRSLLENNVFHTLLILKKDKSYTMERMTEWVTSGSVQY